MGRGKKYNPNSREAVFKRLYGVKPDTFNKMKAILQKEYDKMHKLGGSPPKLTIEDKLTITLKYLREYRTMESIGADYGADYGVSKSTVCESIKWVENTLAKDKMFKLPGKKILKKGSDDIEIVIVDVTERVYNDLKRVKKSITQVKKTTYHQNAGNCGAEKQKNY